MQATKKSVCRNSVALGRRLRQRREQESGLATFRSLDLFRESLWKSVGLHHCEQEFSRLYQEFERTSLDSTVEDAPIISLDYKFMNDRDKQEGAKPNRHHA